MSTIALIQDGTEVARQGYADVVKSFEAAFERMSDDRITAFSFQVFTDEEVGFVLDGIDPDEWACLVFASNALLSWEIENALVRRRYDLHRYIAAGGGVVVLHQLRKSLSPLLPNDLLPVLQVQRASPQGTALNVDGDDVLLQYPVAVPHGDLRDLEDGELRVLRGQGHASELASLFFTAYESDSLPEKLKPVITTAAEEVVLLRSHDDARERVVLATIPLDWQATRPGQAEATVGLLANAIRFACTGSPRRLVWNEEGKTDDELLLRWLTIDGAGAIRPAPTPGRDVDATDKWLLSKVDACVVPSDRLSWCEGREEVKTFLARGGVLATSAPDRALRASRITALVGRYEERALALRLYGELRTVPGWETIDYAFELRNIASALAFLWEDEVNRTNPGAVGVTKLDALRAQLCERLRDPKHREDFGSSVALAETLAHLEEPGKVPPDIVEWMADEGSRRSFDLKLMSRAVCAFCRREQASGFLHEAAKEVGANYDDLGSVAPVVRILDAVAVLEQAGLLAEELGAATELAELTCAALDRFPPVPGRGWLSAEATADVTRGLAALYRRLPPDRTSLAARLGAHAATGAIALRRAGRRYEPDAKGVAKLARVTHSLIHAYWRFPLGLQRLASLEWPDAASAGSAAPAAERTLLERLAHTNEELETERRRLRREVDEQRLPSRVGRAAATLLPVAVLGAASGVAVWKIWFDSIQGIIANAALLLTVLITVLAIVFTWLERRHLLAGPAARIRDVGESVGVPILSALGKLKRQ